MKHGMFVLTVIGTLLIMSGCDKDGPVSPLPVSKGSQVSPGKGAAPVQRQSGISEGNHRDSGRKHRDLYLRASFTTTSVVLAPAPFLRLQITGTGRSTHIGRATFVAYPTVNFTVPPPFPLSGTSVLTAANGDKLFTSLTGSSAPPDPNGNTFITNTQTVNGGTGRFAGATGTLAATAVAHVGSPIGTATLEGTLFLNHRDGDGCEDETALRVEDVK